MPEDRERLFQRIVRALREPVAFGSAFDARVMRAVAALPRHGRRGMWTRLTTPKTVTATPLSWGVLAACVVILVGYSVTRDHVIVPGLPGDTAGAGVADSPALQRVQFVLVARDARKVAVVGDFNGWDASHVAYQAKHSGGGVWSVTAPVPTGHHRYSFVVDDSVWMADPAAPRAIDKDFGLPNSAIVVGAQEQ
jgi:hypothetical protein